MQTLRKLEPLVLIREVGIEGKHTTHSNRHSALEIGNSRS